MRGVCECALKSPLILGRHYDEENKMIAGRQPDSGNPTVRDERRALRKRDEGWCSNSHEAGNGGYTGECLQPNHARAVILLDGQSKIKYTKEANLMLPQDFITLNSNYKCYSV